MSQDQAETSVEVEDSRTTAEITAHTTSVELADSRTTAEISPPSSAGMPDT
jgi:hypothetical protein